MSDIEITSEYLNEELLEQGTEEQKEYNYISVMFEDKYNSTELVPKFYGRKYNYKTIEPLREGQVIRVPVGYSGATMKAVVCETNINPDTINFDLNKIKEV